MSKYSSEEKPETVLKVLEKGMSIKQIAMDLETTKKVILVGNFSN